VLLVGLPGVHWTGCFPLPAEGWAHQNITGSQKKTGVNLAVPPDALHNVPEAAALAKVLEHAAGHDELAKMSDPNTAACLGAAIVHDITQVTSRQTVASISHATTDGYEKYSSLKHPTKEWKVEIATNLALFLMDSGSANGRRLFDLGQELQKIQEFQKLVLWLSKAIGTGAVGKATVQATKTALTTAKVTETLNLIASQEPTSTKSDLTSTCTCGGDHGGCGCSWTGVNKEHCHNDDGTPCFAACCHEANDEISSPCNGLCKKKKWTSHQQCYEQQCAGCAPREGDHEISEACADCAESNCREADLISQWNLGRALETKPGRYNLFVQINACLGAGVVLMLALGIGVSRFHRRQSGQTAYAIASNQENGEISLRADARVA